MDNIETIQNMLKDTADCYVLIDYENRNPILVSLLGEKMLTRKIFLAIPNTGKPFLISHVIDSVFLKDKEITDRIDLHLYKTWQEMLTLEKEFLSGYRTLAMDISEDGLLPRVSLADYGSVNFLIKNGHRIVSSQNIQQKLYAHFSPEEEITQKEACEELHSCMIRGFRKIKEDIEAKGYSDEYEVQSYICDLLHQEGYIYDDPCIVSINHNAADPHYGPSRSVHSRIQEGDVVLIDMWAKKNEKNSVYGDITWMAYVGETVPESVRERFAILRKAVDAGFSFLKENLPLRPVMGYEVDDVVRAVIEKAGYGEYFIHRTGHNISKDVSPHGPGANIDNYESHDTRTLIPGTSFSLEPGIYAPDFGMRLETDVYLDEGGIPHMVGGRQEEVIPLLGKDVL